MPLKKFMPELTILPKKSVWRHSLFLPFYVRLTIYLLVTAGYFALILTHYTIFKAPDIFIISLLPLLVTSWFFSQGILIVNIFLLLFVYLIIDFIFMPGVPLSHLYPYLFIYLLYSFSCLVISKGIRWYKAYEKEYLHNKETEDLLEQGKDWLRMTLLSVGDGVIMVDKEKKIIFMNYEAIKLTDWRLEEAQSRDVADVYRIINEETREPIPDPIGRVQARGFVIGLANHTVLISRNGRETSVGDSGTSIKNKSGDTLGYIIIFRDMSQKKISRSSCRKHRRMPFNPTSWPVSDNWQPALLMR